MTDRVTNASYQVWTVGHSTHSITTFGQILTAHSVQVLIDVRSFPGSRRYPQFNKESLAASLKQLRIDYHHAPLLGGRRQPRNDSHNSAWQNPSFRAYADHMESEDFEQGIAELLALAAGKKTTIMCAEALWWRCHRSLISDYLKVAGHQVIHIIDQRKTEEHPFTAAARIVNGELSYRGLLD
jgi:uncharacterized protein (DUF488 family)